MRIVHFPELDSDCSGSDGKSLLHALGIAVSRSLIVRSHEKCLYSEMQDMRKQNDRLTAIFQDMHFCMPPQSWNGSSGATDTISLMVENMRNVQRRRDADWLVLSKGSCVTRMNGRLLSKLVDQSDWDVLFLNVSQDLLGYREKSINGEKHALVGFCRYYEDGMARMPIPKRWPHHLVIRPECLSRGLFTKEWHASLETFINEVEARGMRLAAYNIAGRVSDLMQENGLLETITGECGEGDSTGLVNRFSEERHFAGPVLCEEKEALEGDAIVLGPTVIADKVKIGHAAVVQRCFLAGGAEVPDNTYIANRVVMGDAEACSLSADAIIEKSCQPWDHSFVPDRERYRNWSRFAYANFAKRLFDLIFASLVLIIFLPVAPIIAILIKLDSKGPVFYQACRQGRFGATFGCLKFRSMRTGADTMQDGLRGINEVDGPQFKMADDPRISRVGRFLRETYLDEIPQFINVFLGQMSVVGPRPSPANENTLCPWWRDTRLSISPGVTGLWQVMRTREVGRDFQEWIRYDTEYVERLSLKMDLWIIYRTLASMVGKFAEQF